MNTAGFPLRAQARAALEALRGPQLALLGLALGLAVWWFGPAALALAIPFGLIALVPRTRVNATAEAPQPNGQMAEMIDTLDRHLRRARRDGNHVITLVLSIDGVAPGPPLPADALGARITTTCLDHLSHVLRREDALFDLGGGRIGVIACSGSGLDAAAATRVAQRMHDTAAAALDGITGAGDLAVRVGSALETRPGTRAAAAVIADCLAAIAPPGHMP